VTEKNVMLPFAVLVLINVIVLICWTAIAPLTFVRTLDTGTDAWNRQIGSYGRCESADKGGSTPYLIIIATVNFVALGIANFQAYRARNIRTEFNESFYIALANASFLQAFVVCLPIVFLTRGSPRAYYIFFVRRDFNFDWCHSDVHVRPQDQESQDF
jgi:7 transmembrane sweet-taste receptor of 3 GCPR